MIALVLKRLVEWAELAPAFCQILLTLIIEKKNKKKNNHTNTLITLIWQ